MILTGLDFQSLRFDIAVYGAKKAGVTHFHVGSGDERLKPLTDLLEQFKAIKPEWLYPTRIARAEALMKEAIDLAKRGSFVDIDTVDGDLPKWFRFYLADRVKGRKI